MQIMHIVGYRSVQTWQTYMFAHTDTNNHTKRDAEKLDAIAH